MRISDWSSDVCSSDLLFPSLVGSTAEWKKHLPRIAGMAFDWIFLNPFHYPGFSGSLYAVKDYYALNPLFAGRSRKSADAILADFVEAAEKRGDRKSTRLNSSH